ncbi:MAG: arsenate reductase (azurin) large subunit [SAR324 cluster bacterium]|uniref:Arsenate reductase (Azurin) large subunit n=1 Tax=SAR324 cluster bacterium TaxID=2024889 RepID=A0A2A4T6B5_9DELT|nr:MAG: arsenate reductase (azurin) large subunit [SAR324 cluster bacterium]
MEKTKFYDAVDKAPLPPKGADVLTTACDYCIVACGYKVYRWPVGTEGGPKASQNAFGVDFPTSALGAWVAPTQHNVVTHNGRKHNVVVVPDKDTEVVNLTGDSSIRGGTIAQKCYNPDKLTKDRLQRPLVRIHGSLVPVSWDFALDIAAEVANHVIDKHGVNAYSVKTFSYHFIENTYAITKYARRHVKTAAFTFHDTPSDVTSTPGFRDAGYDNFGAAYSDWGDADALMICGTDPYETKTVLFTQWIKPAIESGQKVVILNPRETAGVAFAKKYGAVHLDLYPGTDNVVVNAIARIIIENGWQDQDWIDKWVASKWETDSGFGQGTRNTPWQWRTTWGKFQTKGYEDWKKWLFAQDEYKLENASKISGVDPAKIVKAAEYMGKPIDGERPKTSIGIEKGFYWSNNTGNTEAIGALAAVVGAGGRPGQMIARFGGHQRGGQGGGKYPRNLSPEKVPGRRRRALDTDRWLVSGHTRMAHVIGTTWIQAMCGTTGLQAKFEELVTNNQHQVRSKDKQEIIATLKKRADSGGMVVINQDIYLIDPIGAKFADIVFPASGWGENDFMRANGERRLRLYQKFYDAPGESKPDWWIIAQLAKKMGFDGFDWENSNDVAEEAARFSRGSRKDFNMIKVDAHAKGITLHERMRQMGTTGIQGPVLRIEGELVGTVRLHDTTLELPETGAEKGNVFNKKLTHFNSQSGKVNMMKSPWGLFSDFWEWMKPQEDELWVTNGRINEKWQSGYDDTERRPYIKQRWPENFCEIHPDDAKKYGIKNGDEIMVYSKRVPIYKDTILGVKGDDYQFSSLMKNGHIDLIEASVKGIAMVTPAIKKGVLFMDFLDKRQPSNAIQARVVDWISGNYNYKMGVGKIKRIGGSIYQKEQHAMSFKPRNITGA